MTQPARTLDLTAASNQDPVALVLAYAHLVGLAMAACTSAQGVLVTWTETTLTVEPHFAVPPGFVAECRLHDDGRSPAIEHVGQAYRLRDRV